MTIATGDFGLGHEGTMEIMLKGCKISPKEIWCDLTAETPDYDRGLYFPVLATKLRAADGTVFYAVTPLRTLPVKVGVELPFKLGFRLDKPCALPAQLALSGYVNHQPIFANFDVK